MSKSCWHTKLEIRSGLCGVAFDASSHLPVERGEILKIVCVWCRDNHCACLPTNVNRTLACGGKCVVGNTRTNRIVLFTYSFGIHLARAHTSTHMSHARHGDWILFLNSFQFRACNRSRAWFIFMPLAVRGCVLSGRLNLWKRIFPFLVYTSQASRALPIIFIIMQWFWLEKIRRHEWRVCVSVVGRIDSSSAAVAAHAAFKFVCPFEILSRFLSHSHHCNHFNAQNLKMHARESFATFSHFPYFLALISAFDFNWPRTDFTTNTHISMAEVNSRNRFSFIAKWHIRNWKYNNLFYARFQEISYRKYSGVTLLSASKSITVHAELLWISHRMQSHYAVQHWRYGRWCKTIQPHWLRRRLDGPQSNLYV